VAHARRLLSQGKLKIRLTLLAIATVLVGGIRYLWMSQIGPSLICAEQVGRSDLILVDNSDQNYLLFERAAALRKAGLADKVAVPINADAGRKPVPNIVASGVAEVMARVAWLGEFEIVPIVETEPITLHTAYQVRDYMAKRRVRSVLIAVSAFRSRRTAMIYDSVMKKAGMTVRCIPVVGKSNAENWRDTWHGIESVTEQFLKLQYYRFYVLPFAVNDAEAQHSRHQWESSDESTHHSP
jgi:hypothetical protein